MNKLFIDNESYNIEEDNITISQIKRKIYVNGKLISETNKDSVHISFTGNVKELNCNTCDIDGDAFTVHGNSVKGNVGGSIEANSIEVGGNVQGDILGVLTYNVKGSSSSVEQSVPLLKGRSRV